MSADKTPLGSLDIHTVKGVLFDLDGVLYVGNQAIEGAGATLNWLREQQLPFRFITNTSTRTSGDVADRLRAMDLPVEVDEIFSVVDATRSFLKTFDTPSLHLLIRDSLQEQFAEFPQHQSQPDFVVVGDIGAAWDYQLLNRVFRELMDGARLIAMHKNKYWQTEQGLQMDIGAFVAGLEFVAGQQATVIGKPSADFFQQAARAVGFDPGEILVVGDDVENDVGGAQAAGLQGVLVRTGKFRAELVERSDIKPDAIIDSIANLPGLLSGRQN